MRSGIVLALSTAACLTACSQQVAGPPAEPAPPNVLLILSDDHRYDALGCAGNATIRTPNLDRLAATGVRFSQCFVDIPICTPSRASLLTGRFGESNGVTFFGHRIREGVRTWPEIFSARGYQTAFTGKWHNDRRPQHWGFEWTANVFLGGMTGFTNPRLVQGLDDRPREVPGNATELFTEAALRFLEERDGRRPFFLYVAYTAPHDPRDPPPEYERMYDPQTVPLPGNFMTRPPFDPGTLDIRDEKLLPMPRDPEAVRREIARYYAQITHMDTQIGRILDRLERDGLAGSTIVIFGGDNGLTLGSHGLLGKQILYEEGVRVPLIIRHPRLGPAGQTRDALVYLLDLFPTVCEWTRTPVPEGVDGRTIAGVYTGHARSVRDAVFARYDDLFRMIRTPRWKLIEHLKTGRQELFDIRNDPLELNDLSQDPARADAKAELHDQLTDWRRTQRDESGSRGGNPAREGD